jgi:hypothetical protein
MKPNLGGVAFARKNDATHREKTLALNVVRTGHLQASLPPSIEARVNWTRGVGLQTKRNIDARLAKKAGPYYVF